MGFRPTFVFFAGSLKRSRAAPGVQRDGQPERGFFFSVTGAMTVGLPKKANSPGGLERFSIHVFLFFFFADETDDRFLAEAPEPNPIFLVVFLPEVMGQLSSQVNTLGDQVPFRCFCVARLEMFSPCGTRIYK